MIWKLVWLTMTITGHYTGQTSRRRTNQKNGNVVFLEMPNFLCWQGSNSDFFIPKQDHSNQKNQAHA